MQWSEVTVKVPASQVEEASAITQMVVPYGIYIEDYSDLTEEAPKIAHIDLIDEELLQKDREHALIHVYISPEESPAEAISFLTGRLEAVGIPFSISTEQVEEEDWSTAWKKYYHPIRVGKRLVICPSWEQVDLAPGEIKLELDPGMAFGTGTHDTTRLCMQLLEEVVTPESRILDLGCGSGILSIAGVLLGARDAVGVDIDGVAVKVAEENAGRNHVQDRTRFLCGDLTDQVSGVFDLLCANIVADVLIRLAPAVPQFLRQGGAMLASGIIAERAYEVEEALTAVGLTLEKREESGGWVALLCRRA